MFSLVVSMAAAEVTITEDKILMDVDYHEFNDDSLEKLTVNTGTITLTNSGTEAVIVTLAVTGLPTGYTASDVSITIPANATQTCGFISKYRFNVGIDQPESGVC